MSRIQCESLITTAYNANPQSSNNITRFLTDSLGSQKDTCIETLGGEREVVSFLRTIKESNGMIDIPTQQGSFYNETANAGSGIWDFFTNIEVDTIGQNILRGFIYILIGFLIWKLIRYLFIFLYDVFNAKRIIYFKIIQTRGDSKSDREIQKELSKDMKEKISRMTQVFNNFYKLGEVTFYESIMSKVFQKPKITLMYTYEHGQLNFVIGTYPEYQSIIEGAISAQYSDSSIEIIPKPRMFTKKHHDISVIEPVKENVYPIKIYKNMPDDPVNNIIDSLGQVSSYDSFNIMMIIKPMDKDFNKRAKFVADALFKKEKSKVESTPLRKYILMPRKILLFFINGPDKDLIYNNDDGSHGDPMIRMVKAEEDTYQAMGEEAANHAFKCSVFFVSSSDDLQHAQSNIDNVISGYSIYDDQYANQLIEPNVKKDVFGFIFQPMRKFSLNFNLISFFTVSCGFSVNALTSLFHLPDGMFNRSPIISRADYKMLPPPDNLPVFSDANGFIMSGMLAEDYKGGKLSDILAHTQHRAVGKKDEVKTILTPIEKVAENEINKDDIVEKDGKKYYKKEEKKEVRGYKMYNEGVLLGTNIYRNKYSPIYMKRNDRTRHHYCIGKSGTGKSVYLQSVARQDVWSGDGLCMIDPHGDLVEDMLEFIPKSRAKDVIFFDAGNEDRPMGLNLYEIEHPDQADRVVNDATEIFMKMFGPEIFGPRIQEYFKYGSLTLLEDFEDKPTLLDVPRLFTDETYREFKIKRVKNPVVKNFWEKTYNSMGDREKQEIIPYFTSKFVSFNTNRLIRNIIGQTKSAIKLRDAMDNQKIVFISLSKGKIGELNAQLLGMIFVSQIYNAAMGRASMAQEDRKDFMLYVDEFQNFVSGTFADILSEARKYRLCLIMAHQYIAQLESGKQEGGKADVKAAVFGNCGTIQSFKVGASDAEFLEKEYAPVLGAQDIVGIANYKAYIKLNINNSTTRVFSMNAIYTKDYQNKKIAGILKEYSAKKYGRKREFVDAEISARLGLNEEKKEEDKKEETT